MFLDVCCRHTLPAPLWVDIDKKTITMPTQLDTDRCIRRGEDIRRHGRFLAAVR
jgi:hypothetical protein